MFTLYKPAIGLGLLLIWSMAGAEPSSSLPAKSLQERIQLGQTIYEQNCSRCHQPTGEGVPNTFPPLAKSDFLIKNKLRVIDFVMNGHDGTVLVKNKLYMDAMPSFNFNDEEVADVLSYVMNSWGNKGGVVTPLEVAKERTKKKPKAQ